MAGLTRPSGEGSDYMSGRRSSGQPGGRVRRSDSRVDHLTVRAVGPVDPGALELLHDATDVVERPHPPERSDIPAHPRPPEIVGWVVPRPDAQHSHCRHTTTFSDQRPFRRRALDGVINAYLADTSHLLTQPLFGLVRDRRRVWPAPAGRAPWLVV